MPVSVNHIHTSNLRSYTLVFANYNSYLATHPSLGGFTVIQIVLHRRKASRDMNGVSRPLK